MKVKDLELFSEIINQKIYIWKNNHLYLVNKNNINGNRALIIKLLAFAKTNTFTLIKHESEHAFIVPCPKNILIYIEIKHNSKIKAFNLSSVESLLSVRQTGEFVYKLYTGQDCPYSFITFKNTEQNSSIGRQTSQKTVVSPELLFKNESLILDSISKLDRKSVKEALRGLTHVQIIGEIFANNNLIRGEKDTLISFIASLTQTVVMSGLPAKEAYELEDSLIQAIELRPTLPLFTEVIQEIVWIFYNQLLDHRKKAVSSISERTSNYIQNHIREKITLSGISSALNTPKQTLNKAFEAKYSITINQYIRNKKICKAKELLRANILNLEDISKFLSFSSKSYFVQTFRQITGFTPKNFQRKNNNTI
ncbi:putative transcriptional regulator [Oenococcus oeni]|uniref:helix-turn-helix domain-containing protein n=1 Tax=Oenococcus oeni TaxID=1247 RepID=UPI0010BA409B|nr:AraC family transcriptional regulator [Oenococcus oeni]SYW02876.1 putative transcriptional regulator [Oenococcus oeni]